MLICLPFCQRDRHLAVNLLKWIEELGPQKNHDLFLVAAMDTDISGMDVIARRVFREFFTVTLWEDHTGWPQGPNKMWELVSRQIGNPNPAVLPHSQRYFWIEPDGTLLFADGFDQIEAEDKQHGKAFTGARVDVNTLHMSGTGVYPPTIDLYTQRLNQLEMSTQAFDCFFAEEFLPHTHFTKLIQDDYWWENEQKPTFPNQESLSRIHPEAVWFHRCQDGSLIERLREKRGGAKPKIVEAPEITRVTPQAEKTIHAYFQPVDGMDADDQRKLLELWKEEWKKHGWTPVVLSEKDALENPLGAMMLDQLSAYPTINPPGYERACWARWIAMATRGGWMADYDLFPLNPYRLGFNGDIDFYSGNHRDRLIPCLVHGTPAGYQKVLRHFLASKPEGNHWSDMLSLRSFPTDHESFIGAYEYDEPGWDQPSLACVHFSTFSMQPKGLTPKWQHIPSLIPKPKPEPQKAHNMGDITEASAVQFIVALGKEDRFAKVRIIRRLREGGYIIPAESLRKQAKKAKRRLAKV